MAGISIGDEKVSAGTKAVHKFRICRMATGEDLHLVVHIVAGRKDGPTLLLLNGTHGDANFSIDVIKAVVEETDPEKLSGNILGVPMMNPPGFEAGTRNTPVIFNDNLNMGRTFPGKKDGRITERLTYVVTEELMKKSDCVVSFAGGEKESIIDYTLVSEEKGELGQKLVDFSKAYGDEMLYLGPVPFGGTDTDCAISLGKVGITSELGHEWYNTDKFLQRGITGVRNIMKKMKMIDGSLELPERQYILRRRVLLLASNGGIYYPAEGIDHLTYGGKVFAGGTVIGRIIDPYTFELLDELKAPYKESVIIWGRVGRGRVNPGDYCYLVGDYSSVEWVRGGPAHT